MTSTPADLHALVEGIYRAESRRVFATLVRLVRDFDLAEEALHEAIAAAVERWGREGVPDNPRSYWSHRIGDCAEAPPAGSRTPTSRASVRRTRI